MPFISLDFLNREKGDDFMDELEESERTALRSSRNERTKEGRLAEEWRDAGKEVAKKRSKKHS